MVADPYRSGSHHRPGGTYGECGDSRNLSLVTKGRMQICTYIDPTYLRVDYAHLIKQFCIDLKMFCRACDCVHFWGKKHFSKDLGFQASLVLIILMSNVYQERYPMSF